MENVCKFFKGRGISKEDISDTGNPCILYGELYTTYKTAIAKTIKSKTLLDLKSLVHSKLNDVLIPCSGETAEDISTSICIPYNDVLIGGDLTIIRSQLNGAFLSNQINSVRKLDIARIAQGKSIVHLQADELKKINISFPTIDEQLKIATFIDLLDQRIDTQSKIIEDLDTLKNSIMDQLLMRDIFDEISIKDFINQGYARIIKASEMKKFSGEKLYLSTSSIDKNGIFKIECKISYNDRPGRASMIPIKNSVWFAKMKDSIKVYKSENDDESKYILSTGFYGILCNEDVVNPDWMVEIFKSNYFNNQKDRFSEGSSMSGIKENQLEDIKVKLFKNKNLEKKYCQLFYILNKKLNVETDYLEKLKEQKKYLLSNMFI